MTPDAALETVAPAHAWPWPRLIAHRGSGTMAPENTLEGFRVGRGYGFTGFETDAMLAADGVPVLMHDEMLGRTVRGETRRVPEVDSREIRCMDAGSWFDPAYTGVPPAGFEQALAWCMANRIWLNIEIKPAAGHEEQTGHIVAQITQRYYRERLRAGGAQPGRIVDNVPLFSSFSVKALAAAAKTAPDIPRALLVKAVPDNVFALCRELRCCSLNVKETFITPALISACHSNGLWCFAYTVNDTDRARELTAMGLDAFCTDRLDRFAPGA